MLKRIGLAFALAAALDARAAEVVVLSAGAVKAAFGAVAAAWEKTSGEHVNASFATAGVLRQRIAAGEAADLIIVPAEQLEPLARAGAIDPATRRDLGVVAIGVAVRQGATVPDISTPDAFKRALLAAKSVTYTDPAKGTSGKHFDEQVLTALGIRDAVRAKAVLGEGGYIAEKVARGEVEMAVHQMTEILPVKGVTVVGPLPRELQKLTVYSGAVAKSARNPGGAQALLDRLASPAGREAFTARGFSAP